MLSCSIMKNRAILDQIARITYIANNDRTASLCGVKLGVNRAPPPKKGADDSIVSRMISKNLRDEIDATQGRFAAVRTCLKVALSAPGFSAVFGQRSQQCG
jgi:hypothetical protein